MTTTTTSWPAYAAGSGELVGYHVREDLEDGGKTIRWVGADGSPGLGGFPTKELALYDPDPDHNLEKSGPLVLCEGEKAADACNSVGIRALGTVCGASGTPSPEALAVLLEEDGVAMWADNDGAGETHMNNIAAELTSMGASGLGFVRWDDAPPKGDAADAVAAGVDMFKLVSGATPIGPMITRHGSKYRISWSNLPITVEVRDIKQRGDSFKAQVAVFHKGRWIHRSNPTLDSVSGMDQLRRTLDRRLPGEDIGADWGQLVEDIASIQDIVRKGEPSVVMGEVEDNGDAVWQVHPFLIAGEPTVLWASGGIGKSFFAIFLSTLVQESIVDSDHQLSIEPTNVLYLDWETTQSSLASRFRKVHAGLGIDTPSRVRYRRMSGQLIYDIDAVRDEVAEHNIGMVVIDSMGMACGELESAQPVLEFFSAVNSLSCTALILTHSTKLGELYGSAYTQAAARSIWEAKQGEGRYDKGSMDLSLFHRKSNDTALQPSMAWHIEYTDQMTRYTRGDVMDTDSAVHLSYVDLVFRLLAEEPGTPRSRGYLEMAILDIKREHGPEQVKRNVTTAISRQKARGALYEKDGLIGLVDTGPGIVEEVLP